VANPLGHGGRRGGPDAQRQEDGVLRPTHKPSISNPYHRIRVKERVQHSALLMDAQACGIMGSPTPPPTTLPPHPTR